MESSLVVFDYAPGFAFSARAKECPVNAVGAGTLKTLRAALGAARFVDTLTGKGLFTVFAPADAASAETVRADLDILPTGEATLTAVLNYRVVSSKLIAADVKAFKVKTVHCSELTVSTMGGVMVDGANSRRSTSSPTVV